MNPFLQVAKALHQSECRYVIVGGFAVVMYGNNRFTPDVNVVLDLKEDNLRAALEALCSIGLAADQNIDPMDFTEQSKREKLQASSDKMFFSLSFSSKPFFSVELFYDSPLPFDQLLDQSGVIEFHQSPARICSLPHLFEMKKEASRPQDIMDIDNLLAAKLIEDNNITEESNAPTLKGAPQSIDTERIKDLISFIQTSPQEKLNWLENMLEALGHFSAF